MTLERATPVADAILYEGYMLYPYRRSALKDRIPSLFGVLRPHDEAGADGDRRLGCEILVTGSETSVLDGVVRALIPRSPDEAEGPVAEPCVVALPSIDLGRLAREPLDLRSRAGAAPRSVEVAVRLGASAVAAGVYRLAIEIVNVTPASPAGTPGPRLVSTQAVLHARGAEFVPPRDPPPALAAASAACQRGGLWPTLLGRPGDRDLLICAPIILDDHPEIAPESPGDLFDGTEIDEMLTLRIQTLSEGERREIASGDDRVRSLIARAEAARPEDLGRLHGALRRSPPPGAEDWVRVGDRVRLRPRGRADIFDIALAGKLATVVSVERDLEDRIHLAVTVDEDPGRDLGALGKPGHRFFFGLDEVERAPGR